MRRLKNMVLLGSVAMALSGCAGIPTAFTFASAYLNSIVFLRTEKGLADHAVSAAMDRDCGFTNFFRDGAYCIDAPAPDLMVAMLAEPGTVSDTPTPVVVAAAKDDPPSGGAMGVTAATPRPTSQPVTRIAVAAKPISEPAIVQREMANSPVRSLPAAGLPPASPPVTGVAMARGGMGVVLGSYQHLELANAHLARLGRDDARVVTVIIDGEPRHRVTLVTRDAAAARAELARLRASGAPDAWVTAVAPPGGAIARVRVAKPASPTAVPDSPAPPPTPVAAPTRAPIAGAMMSQLTVGPTL